jgi:hydroxyacylglutathione hydrolase
MEASARTLFQSLQRFRERPDWLQIWPGHGAGSSCGKGISAIPHSTLGYEKRFNWAFQITSEDEFVKAVLAGQPDPPLYFAEMKRINKEGPRLLGGFTRPEVITLGTIERRLRDHALVIDTRAAADFALGHIPGTINIPLNASFTTWAGWLVPYDADVFLIVDERTPPAIDTLVRDLAMIGLDRIGGYADSHVLDAWTSAGRALGTVPQIYAPDLAESLKHGGATLVDVRNTSEWTSARIDGARHIPLGHLPRRLDEIPRTRPVVVQCASGARSSIAASVLKARGFDQVINLVGGIGAWTKAGLPTVTST